MKPLKICDCQAPQRRAGTTLALDGDEIIRDAFILVLFSCRRLGLAQTTQVSLYPRLSSSFRVSKALKSFELPLKKPHFLGLSSATFLTAGFWRALSILKHFKGGEKLEKPIGFAPRSHSKLNVEVENGPFLH